MGRTNTRAMNVTDWTDHSFVTYRPATSFSISRRRMVVPIYKRWEVNSARLQIIKQNKVVQLVGFFKDFAHGSCMNFTLKSTDVFESLARSGIYYVRIVDAKFALPKTGEDTNKDFVCLDMPEYPGEHDDITIGFEVEAGTNEYLYNVNSVTLTVRQIEIGSEPLYLQQSILFQGWDLYGDEYETQKGEIGLLKSVLGCNWRFLPRSIQA